MNLSARYLLDTNILLHLVRGSNLVADLEARFALFTGRNLLHVSYVVIGEIRVLGEENAWGPDKWTTLARVLRSCVVLPLIGEEILDAYVALDTYSRYQGRDVGKMISGLLRQPMSLT